MKLSSEKAILSAIMISVEACEISIGRFYSRLILQKSKGFKALPSSTSRVIRKWEVFFRFCFGISFICMNLDFGKVLFLNSNIPEKRHRIFWNKEEIDELLEDSADIFQHNMLDRYIDCPDENLMGGKYSAIDAMCFAEFLLY